MSRRWQLVIIVCTVVSITAITSHSIIAWLRIETTFGGYWVTGPGNHRPLASMAGSSLAGDGLSWRQIGDALNLKIGGWGIAGSSPSEWERFEGLAAKTSVTFLVVSVYDLNEYWLCDFRAEIVPLGQTIKDLWKSPEDWAFCKRLLSLYPTTYLRRFFPTVGRSEGVMVGVREKIKGLVGALYHMESEAGPTLSLDRTSSAKEGKTERISNWSEGRMLRRLASMHNACHGRHAFEGPKNLALERMLHQAENRGRVFVVVLPVSPAYAREFLSPEVRREFEASLAELQHKVPQSRWIRLDQVDELNSNDYFWDLVHMNTYGQQIATEDFIGAVKAIF